MPGEFEVPQGLKPSGKSRDFGTAEAVPLQKNYEMAGSLRGRRAGPVFRRRSADATGK